MQKLDAIHRIHPAEYTALAGHSFAPIAGSVTVPQLCGYSQKISSRKYSGQYIIEGKWQERNHVVYKLSPRLGVTYYLENYQAPTEPSWFLIWEREGKHYRLVVYPKISITAVPTQTES